MDDINLNSVFVQFNIPVPFTGKVTIDGQLVTNMENAAKLSDVLANESDRTFSFAGVITDTTGVNYQTVTNEKKLAASDCGGSSGIVITRSGSPY
jgi:hypothetical protein